MKKITKKIGLSSILIVLLLTLATSVIVLAEDSATPAVSGSDTQFRFVVIPDTHYTTGSTKFTAAERVVDKITKEIKPSFVLHTGDMINVESPAAAKRNNIEGMWSRFKKEMLDPIRAANIRFFPSPGNHDSYSIGFDKYQTFWKSFDNGGFVVSGPSKYAGWYSFDVGNAHFVSLQIPGYFMRKEEGKEQVAWLKSDLAAAKQRGKGLFFVFTHSPYLCTAKRPKRCTGKTYWMTDKDIIALAKEYKVVWIAGHMHVFDDKVKDGVRSIIDGHIGGGGGSKNIGFLVVDVDGTQYKVHQIKFPNFDVTGLPQIPLASFASTGSAGSGTTSAGSCPAGYVPKTSSGTTLTPSTNSNTGSSVTTVSAISSALVIGKGPGCTSKGSVLVLGDSITFHGTRKGTKGFVTQLREQCKIRSTAFDNSLAKPGKKTSYMLDVYKKEVAGKNRYSQIIIMGGVNDVRMGVKAEIIKKNLAEIYALAKKDKMSVIAMTITPFYGTDEWNTKNGWTKDRQMELEKVNAWILSKPPNVDAVVNTYKALGDPARPEQIPRKYQVWDYLHPNKAGHDIIFQQLAKLYPKPTTV